MGDDLQCFAASQIKWIVNGGRSLKRTDFIDELLGGEA
jgi:hypothetical protein